MGNSKTEISGESSVEVLHYTRGVAKYEGIVFVYLCGTPRRMGTVAGSKGQPQSNN